MFKKLMAVMSFALLIGGGSFAAPHQAQAEPEIQQSIYADGRETDSAAICDMNEVFECAVGCHDDSAPDAVVQRCVTICYNNGGCMD